MEKKETIIEKLAKMAQEYEAQRKLPVGEWVKERLRWENWEWLCKEAVVVAERTLMRRGRGDVLPGGFDAESVALEVIADVLDGKSAIAPGWTLERLMRELTRLIRNKVRVLERLKEGLVTQSEWVRGADGQERSMLGQVEAKSSVLAEEGFERLLHLKGAIEVYLAGEPELLELFECRCEGMKNPAKIAQRLGIEEQEVVRRRKRLDRRLVQFQKLKN